MSKWVQVPVTINKTFAVERSNAWGEYYMSKWVEVPVTINKTFAVEISNEQTVDDAITAATDECMGDDVTIEEGNCFIADTDHQAEQIKRLSDETIAL